MITNSLKRTKSATFAVQVPNPTERAKGFPSPYGTGFFISPEGYFITARHVLLFSSGGTQTFFKPAEITLAKPELIPQPTIKGLELIQDWTAFDLALLKADFGNAKGDYFRQKKEFDFLEVDFKVADEGAEVYSFGYPLPDFDVMGRNVIIGMNEYRPRTTSAIISSHYENIGVAWVGGFPIHYVIDKALNLGNSGGPIILQENGKAISVCTHFDPVNVIQSNGNAITIPSLYGVTSSLKNIEGVLSNVL